MLYILSIYLSIYVYVYVYIIFICIYVYIPCYIYISICQGPQMQITYSAKAGIEPALYMVPIN